jgi:hypothetical protein
MSPGTTSAYNPRISRTCSLAASSHLPLPPLPVLLPLPLPLPLPPQFPPPKPSSQSYPLSSPRAPRSSRMPMLRPSTAFSPPLTATSAPFSLTSAPAAPTNPLDKRWAQQTAVPTPPQNYFYRSSMARVQTSTCSAVIGSPGPMRASASPRSWMSTRYCSRDSIVP